VQADRQTGRLLSSGWCGLRWVWGVGEVLVQADRQTGPDTGLGDGVSVSIWRE
jgi:hypothetical protein